MDNCNLSPVYSSGDKPVVYYQFCNTHKVNTGRGNTECSVSIRAKFAAEFPVNKIPVGISGQLHEAAVESVTRRARTARTQPSNKPVDPSAAEIVQALREASRALEYIANLMEEK